MASWLKAAEDLFEVVDRRAKIVASELSEEHSHANASAAPSGQEGQLGKKKSKEKSQLKFPTFEAPKVFANEKDRTNSPSPSPPLKITKIKPSTSGRLVDVNIEESAPSFDGKVNKEDTKDAADKKDKLIDIETDVSVKDRDEVSPTEPATEVPSSSASKIDESAVSEDNAATSASSELDKRIDPGRSDEATNVDPSVNLEERDSGMTVGQEKSQTKAGESHNIDSFQENEKEYTPEPTTNLLNHHRQKSDQTNMMVQDQLDEAQGLLKTAAKTGQSKEARLARVCAGLSSRVQEYKSENAQLEELLVQEREKCSSYESHIKQMLQELSVYRTETSRAESNMVGALAAKNSEIESLTRSMEALRRKAADAEEKVAQLEEGMENVMRNRELTETRVIQALREELAIAERRAEEERAAHSATKMAAVDREVELEHRAVEASNALARIQRTADESTSRATDLEHKVAVLEVECASLHRELEEMEARNRRAQKRPSEEANQALQMQAWQEEAERARQSQREAETKISSLEAELQKMRVEMAGMKRDAEHYSRQEHIELEKRYRELTDLLYHKQTQLETMASEKAALEFQLEKEIRRLQEMQVEADRNRITRRSVSSWEEDADIKAFEPPLPLHHRHMAAASKQLQNAAKLLDSGAVRATRFLWRYPTARIILLFYLVFVHLFLMYLLHRLQVQADHFASREMAATMGLGNTTL